MTDTRRLLGIVNPNAGVHGPVDRDALRAAFDRAGLDVTVKFTRDGDEIAAAVQDAVAQSPTALIVGGGDGTVSTVATGLVGSSIALGILPLGTYNHLARDLRIPLELDAAARTIAEGYVARIDVGEVNGRPFLNNSSLGLYPSMVLRRQHQQRHLGRARWLAATWAILTTLHRYPFVRLRLIAGGEQSDRRTPFVLIGNNEYQLEGFRIGERGCLDRGQLSVYMAHRAGRWGLVVLAMRALLGRLQQAHDFEALCAPEIRIESPHGSLAVALDGEVMRMTTPLHYQVRPGALRVIVPAPATGQPAAE